MTITRQQRQKARFTRPSAICNRYWKTTTYAIHYLRNSFKLDMLILQNFPYHALVKHFDSILNIFFKLTVEKARLSTAQFTASDVTKRATCAICWRQNNFKFDTVIVRNFPYRALVEKSGKTKRVDSKSPTL